MFKFIIALLLVQALYCAEFPGLEKHIKMVWNNTDVTEFDGSQTVSDKDGNVDYFTLCGAYNNSAFNGDCSFNFSYAEQTSSGSIFSTSGSGEFLTNFVSKVNETYSCLQFANPVGGFKDVYDATLLGRGSYSVSYSCSKYVPKKDYTWLIVGGVIGGIVIIVGGIFALRYLKKKKEVKEGQTTGGHALLQNA